MERSEHKLSARIYPDECLKIIEENFKASYESGLHLNEHISYGSVSDVTYKCELTPQLQVDFEEIYVAPNCRGRSINPALVESGNGPNFANFIFSA